MDQLLMQIKSPSAAAKAAGAVIDGRAQLSEDRANGLPFVKLCEKFERVCQESNKMRCLKILFTQSLHDHLKGFSIFPIMRLILPQLDRERSAYGIKIATMSKLYIKVLGLSASNPSAQRLRNWKDPRKYNNRYGGKSSQSSGDFPALLEEELQRRANQGGTATIGWVNSMLDKLALINGQEALERWLLEIFSQCSANEQKWIVRIVLKDMKIRLKHERVLNFYHPDALEYYHSCTNLREVVDTLRDPNERRAQEFRLGRPFIPMLAKRLPSFTLEKCMGRNSFLVEPKMDGERILCHKIGAQLKLFTRNANDYTDLYGPVLAPLIMQNVNATNCILDGEMMAWDNHTKQFVKFGHNKTVAHEQIAANIRQLDGDDYGEDTERWLCYVMFDIIWVEGAHPSLGIDDDKNLVRQPLKKRREVLRALLKPVPTRLMLAEGVEVTNDDGYDRMLRHRRTMEAFDDFMAAAYEGAMIKDLTSPYLPGETGRKSLTWVKLKPDYIDQLDETLDLIILGGYYGEGSRRSGDLSTFLMGVAEDFEPGTKPTKFRALCKVGTGYSFVELMELRERLKPYYKIYDVANRPPHFEEWRPGKRDDVPDIWIEPQHSYIMELKAGELVTSDQFNANMSLRFPRVVRMRYDKPWHSCWTMRNLEELQTKYGGGLHKKGARHIGIEELARMGLKNKRLKRKARQEKAQHSARGGVTVMAQFRATDVSNVRISANVLGGKEVCVLAQKDYPKTLNKALVEKLVHSLGGKLVQNQLATTDYVIGASDKGFRAKNMRQNGTHDLTSYKWLLRCEEEGNFSLPRPCEVIYATPNTQERLRQLVDAYGDSFTQDIGSAEELLRLFDNVECEHYDSARALFASPAYKALDLEERMAMEYDMNCLNRAVVYVDMWEDLRVQEGDAQSNIEKRAEEAKAASQPKRRTRSKRRRSADADSATTATTPPVTTPAGGHAWQLSMRLLSLRLRLLGATIAPHLHEAVTHILLDPDHLPHPKGCAVRREIRKMRLRACQPRKRSRRGGKRQKGLRAGDSFSAPEMMLEKHVVSVAWALDCVKWHALIDVDVKESYSVSLSQFPID